MYVTLTDIQNGEPVFFASVPGTACVWGGGEGGLEVALCELTYYHCWLNIGAELGNSKGYYNVCELDKEAFRPLGAELSLHAPTGRLQLSVKKRLVLSGGLAELLGFSRETFEPGQSHIADEPHRQYVGEPPQRSPLHTAEIHPHRERKVRGWPDRDIPRLAVQTAGIGASFPADAHDIRHG